MSQARIPVASGSRSFCLATWRWRSTSRYGLNVPNFAACSNHIHLFVYDAFASEPIARRLQPALGCTAQARNRRRGRAGAFWHDCYHAVTVDSEAAYLIASSIST